jgi:hypothetical protein
LSESSQTFANGVHLIHMESIAVPRTALRVKMTIQSEMRIQRARARRSSVRAKDVLLQAAARTEKKPAKTATKGILGRFSGRMS